MKIIPTINDFINTFNESFAKNLTPLNLESKIRNVGDDFTRKMYETILNYFDSSFKASKIRKENYNIKETRRRTLITSIGTITVNSTSYINKETKEYFVPLRDILNIKPYQRLTNEAEYLLIKYTMEGNMTFAAKHALRNTILSRSTVSKKIRALKGSINEEITRVTNQPDILYIEMDEIHANLQKNGNKICPCAIVHEGHIDEFTKRKVLKNIRYFASAELSYEELWEVIYDYVDKRYDISKFKKIFVSGDGATGIKNFQDCFPDAIFVLDPFHYKLKHLKYLFKRDSVLTNLADTYIRERNITDFKSLVNLQIKKYPDQESKMKNHYKCIINNIDGIINQHDEDYKAHCSMEGHVSQAFARHITSSPYGFSIEGLENKLKLLVYHANKHELTIEDYLNLKYGNDKSKEIIDNIKQLTNIKYDQKLTSDTSSKYEIQTANPIFDSPKLNNQFKELTSIRQEIYVI